MPLLKQDLVNGIRSINDQQFSGFIGFPKNNVEVAQRWSDIVFNYAKNIVPVSKTVLTAKNTFQSVFVNITFGTGLVIFNTAFISFATEMALGMQPEFTSTIPTIPLVLEPVFIAGVSGANAEFIANTMATIIDTWFKFGVAINNTSGVTTTWQ